MYKITGSGGSGNSGGSSGAAPTESQNTLRSKSDAIVLFAVCEGEIQGFSTPSNILQSIYLDDTPVQNLDGSLNFQNFNIDYRFGTQYQSYIPGMASDIENETQVGVQIKQSTGPIVRTITNLNANAFRLKISIPSLLEQDDKGNIKEASVTFRVEIADISGNFVRVMTKEIKGKTSGAYQEAYRFTLASTGPWNIRISRVSADSQKTTLQTTLFWESFTEIIDVKLSYPNTVLAGVRLSAEQFSSIPKIALKLKLLKILIPANYDPVTRNYSGIFDGTLYVAYSNNPAWIFYDLATNARYGSGKYISDYLMDVYDLYSIGQYCDELVSNGRGGLEPRFTCNCIIQTQDDAFKILSAIASCFRGMMFERAGEFTAIQDKLSAPVRAYTNANVVCDYDENGQMTNPPFNYSGTGLDTRFTVVRVSYSDPDNLYKTAEEVVEDVTAIARYGYIPTEIVAFGCTSRGQAYRLGKWYLLSQRLLTQVVSFKVGAEGLLVLPGEVFKVMDSLKSVNRLGGRIVSAITTSVTLDSSVTILADATYTLTIIKSDGKTESSRVTNAAGSYTVLGVSPAFTEVPRHIWILESNQLSAQLFRCSSVSDTEQDHVYEITGTEYNASIYSVVESSGFVLDTPNTSNYPNPSIPPNPPGNLTVTDSLYENLLSASVGVRVNIYWSASDSSYIDRYQIEYRPYQDSVYQIVGTTKDLSIELLTITSGLYFFRVKTINRYGVSSVYSEVLANIKGLIEPPLQVQNFNVVFSNTLSTFSWNQTTDLDVKVGGYFKIKYTSKLTSVTWAEGVEVAKIPGTSNSFQTYAMTGTYLIKAVDSSGQQSANATQLIVGNTPGLLNKNIVITSIQDPLFAGNKVNTIATGSILKLSSLDYFDGQPGNFDTFPGSFDNVAGYSDSYLGNFDDAIGLYDDASVLIAIFPQGTYDFTSPIDLLGIYPVRITYFVSGYSVNESLIFDRTGSLFDSNTGLFDGSDNDNSSLMLYVATSQDGSNYTSYQPLLISDYIARAFKFRAILTSGSANHNYFVEKLSITIDLPDRTETGTIASSSSVNTTVTFINAFATQPEIAVTLLSSNVGDYVEIISKSSSNFIFNAKNSSGVRVVRTISWLAKGYGQLL
jgi:predicted phage tail protein